ncbi:MAG: hypothetical protein KBG83_00085 [Bacteroidetes bacterium]|jgi:hypothetical protein|nr:hypothetical protein [Bacteroidota bacterium]
MKDIYDATNDPDVLEIIDDRNEILICGFCGENIEPEDRFLLINEEGERFFIHRQHVDEQDDARA